MTTKEQIAIECQTLCKNIKYLREANNLTKVQMAKIMKCSVSSLNKIENGIIPNLSSEIIFLVSSHFKIEPSKLFLPIPLPPTL